LARDVDRIVHERDELRQRVKGLEARLSEAQHKTYQLEQEKNSVEKRARDLETEKNIVESHAQDLDRKLNEMRSRYKESVAELNQMNEKHWRQVVDELGKSNLLTVLYDFERQGGSVISNDSGGGTYVSVKTIKRAVERLLRNLGLTGIQEIYTLDSELTIRKADLPGRCKFIPEAPWKGNVVSATCKVIYPGWEVNGRVIEQAELQVTEIFEEAADKPDGSVEQPAALESTPQPIEQVIVTVVLPLRWRLKH
jgi:hypothetical protein